MSNFSNSDVLISLDTPDIQDDRKWFERNPGRRYRLRRARPGELELLQCHKPPNMLGSILVEQIRPGARIRIPLIHTEWPCSALRADETWLAALADHIRSRNPNVANAANLLRAVPTKARP